MSEHNALLRWRRSSFCSSSSCVEVSRTLRTVQVRDSKDPARPPLTVPVAAWREFIQGLKRGDLGHAQERE
jgi:hypothetical protein